MKKISVAVIACVLFSASFAYALTKDMEWVKYGLKMHKSGQYEKAIIAYEKAIETNPDNSFAYQFTGEAYLMLKDNDLAIENFQRAYDISPSPAVKKKLEALTTVVVGEGRFFLYPFSFDVLFGAAGDSAGDMYTREISGIFKYAGFVNYNIFNWLAVRSGIMGGPRVIDIPILVKGFMRVFNSDSGYGRTYSSHDLFYTLAGLNLGIYINLDAVYPEGISAGYMAGIDGRIFLGPVAISSMGYLQWGMSGGNMARLALGWMFGIAF